jgi:D-lyxose ketol-isomerase
MKRSEINSIMRRADEFLHQQNFHLPPFAYWSLEEWRSKGPEVREIVQNRLGWDITDFGRGEFERFGLFLFTIRNGSPANWKTMKGKLYAEKIMIAEEGQETPMHFHWSKMEDIINRGNTGRLAIQLYSATPDEQVDESSHVTVWLDGVESSLPAGTTLSLKPGESITLPQYCYHSFWAEGGRVLIGEVSMVNDDNTDNRFAQKLPRFSAIEEDELPLHLLCSDYTQYVRHLAESNNP